LPAVAAGCGDGPGTLASRRTTPNTGKSKCHLATFPDGLTVLSGDGASVAGTLDAGLEDHQVVIDRQERCGSVLIVWTAVMTGGNREIGEPPRVLGPIDHRLPPTVLNATTEPARDQFSCQPRRHFGTHCL
jgi:hypothetical protein